MTCSGFPRITKEELTQNKMLKTHVLYSLDIQAMSKEKQEEIYRYCKAHATFPGCRENLKQIRIAVTRIYFGD